MSWHIYRWAKVIHFVCKFAFLPSRQVKLSIICTDPVSITSGYKRDPRPGWKCKSNRGWTVHPRASCASPRGAKYVNDTARRVRYDLVTSATDAETARGRIYCTGINAYRFRAASIPVLSGEELANVIWILLLNRKTMSRNCRFLHFLSPIIFCHVIFSLKLDFFTMYF